MYKIKFLLILLVFQGCNIDFKNRSMASRSIEESKAKNFFIKEYQITDIEVFDSSYHFPIKQVWSEKQWHLELDERGKEISVNSKSKGMNIIFRLPEKDNLFNLNNLSKKWIMWGNHTLSIGQKNGMCNSFLPERYADSTIIFNIYKYEEKEEDIPIFRFTLR